MDKNLISFFFSFIFIFRRSQKYNEQNKFEKFEKLFETCYV